MTFRSNSGAGGSGSGVGAGLRPARVMSRVALAAVLALAAAGCGERAQPVDSVLLITLDTLRADHVSCYGAAHVQTPHLDAIAARGARVDGAWTTVPLTTPAHASILSGLYPPTHGVRNNARFRLPDSVETLAEIYRGAGRRTAAFISSFTTSAYFGLGQGFDTFDDDMGQDVNGRRRTQRPGNEVVDEAAAWLERSAGQPFFLWVHLFDPHTPYDPPADWRQRHPGDPYAAEVAFTDHLVGRLVAQLEKTGAAGRTVVVALADHGEGLNSHGEPEHGLLLYEETVHVPFVLAAPGRIAPGTVVAGANSTLDVAPTVLALTGLPVPAAMQGRNLWGPAGAPRDIYAETLYPHEEFAWSAVYALRRGDLKYLASSRPEMYDLAADPRETRNLVPARAAEAAGLAGALRQKAETLVDEARLATAAGFGGDADPETIARLESLGYVAGGGGAEGGAGAGADGALPALNGPAPATMMEDYRLFDRAQELVAAGQGAAAIPIYEKLLRRDPRNPQLGLKLAHAFDRTGRAPEAEAAYRALVEKHPTFYLGYRSFSDFLERQQRPRESRELWLRLLGLLPGYVGLEVRLAQSEVAAGLVDEAGRRLDAYVDTRPDDPDAWALLGKVRAAKGNVDGALEAYRRALDRQPTHPAAVDGAVTTLVAAGRADEARALVEALLRRDPADPLLQRTLKAIAAR